MAFFLLLFIAACSSEPPTPEEGSPEQQPPTVIANTAIPNPEPSPSATTRPTPTAEPSPIPLADQEPVRILFIGSSHIFHGPTGHDLPRMFSGMAVKGNHQVDVDRSSESGVWLIDHLDDDKTMEKLNEESWDYVILQEDMYMGAREDGKQETMFPAIRALVQKAEESGAETILFNTWVNPAPFREGNLEEYQANQSLLSAGYLQIGEELDIRVASVDQAFLTSLEERPDMYLWSEADDHGHANFLGSYLAAAVFYAMIFDESPVGLDYIYVDEETSNYLQTIAAETIFGEAN